MSMTQDELIEIIRAADTQINFDKLTADVEFDTIGADSLDIMNILLGVQDRAGIEIPDEEVVDLGSIRKILARINNA